MNTIRSSTLRGMAVAAVATAGIVTTLATGGGDGGSIAPPPTSSGPTLAITADNGFGVSSTLVIALGASFDLGDITGGEITASAAVPFGPISGLPSFEVLLSKPTAVTAQLPEECLISGTRDVTAVLADPNTVTVGDRITAVFVECDDDDGFVISGTVDMTVAAYEGDIFTDTYLLSVDVVMTGVSIVDGTETMMADGDYRLTLDSLDFPVVSVRLAGSELEFSYNGVTNTLLNFDQYLESDGNVVPDTKRAEASGRLLSVVLGGSIDYESTVPIRAIGDYDPHTGEILITGADDSSVRIVIVDNVSVVLEIDANGDGVVDSYVDTTWAELNNDTSSINSSTAPVIAREVLNAVAGFGSLTITAGAQFQALAPFGALQQQAVSGEFGSVEINCAISGTTSISGFINEAGTYSANDSLDAEFIDCARGLEILQGRLQYLVIDHMSNGVDVFRVVGGSTMTNFERTAGGLVFQGNGEFFSDYDYFYTQPGKVLMNASANAFAVSSGGTARNLTGPTVVAEITAGQPPVEISRASSGHIASAALEGSYYYESLVADIFYFDDDPTTGPVSGQLLVTATDGSTLLLRAVNETFVRLEIDLDGDSVTDATIDTTWAALL